MPPSPVRITLEPYKELQWLGPNPAEGTALFKEGQYPLWHQWLTSQSQADLIVNTYNTGTGKTKAALLRLYQRAKDKDMELDLEDNALLIVPTNELLYQHVKDAEEFCTKTNLPYAVMPVTRLDLDEYQETLKQKSGDYQQRRGTVLDVVLRNPREVQDYSKTKGKRATLVVTNPDIFYYAFYEFYHHHDRNRLFRAFMDLFNFIIIDELHYYNPKQFATFLFYMYLSKHQGYVGSQTQTRRQFCLLTATPSKPVRKYLEQAFGKENVEWIAPSEQVPPEGQTKEVLALAETVLELYSTEECSKGVIDLVEHRLDDLTKWLHTVEDSEPVEGALISGALWHISQVYQRLSTSNRFNKEWLGRITGPETRADRQTSSQCRFILATPTVDIGYNFDKLGRKRQNIDFLLFESRTGDEFIQRLGRAGRILGKDENFIRPSWAVAVADAALYEALKPYDGQRLGRTALRDLVLENLPERHQLYSYIQSGAIAEAFRPLYEYFKKGSATEDEKKIEALFEQIKTLFGIKSSCSYGMMKRQHNEYEQQSIYYGKLETIPRQVFECLCHCQSLLRCKDKGCSKDAKASPAIKKTLERFNKSKDYRASKSQDITNQYAMADWLEEDLRNYFVRKAQFSFREYFQPPQALIYDPDSLLSQQPIKFYDILHVVKNYELARLSTAFPEWWQGLEGKGLEDDLPIGYDKALFYCHLGPLYKPDERRELSFSFRSDLRKTEWEQRFAYRVTALHGLELVPKKGDLDVDLRDLFKARFVPCLVANSKESHTANTLRKFAKAGDCYPYQLQVSFSDLDTGEYLLVAGTQALSVWAEAFKSGSPQRDLRRIQSQDDSPLIC